MLAAQQDSMALLSSAWSFGTLNVSGVICHLSHSISWLPLPLQPCIYTAASEAELAAYLKHASSAFDLWYWVKWSTACLFDLWIKVKKDAGAFCDEM